MKYQLTVEQIDQVMRAVSAAIATSFIDKSPMKPHKPEWTIAASFDPVVIDIPDEIIEAAQVKETAAR